MNIPTKKELVGKIVRITDIRPTKKENRFYTGIEIAPSFDESINKFYNLFGSEDAIKKQLESLEVGSEVKITFHEKAFNGRVFNELKTISPIVQGTLQSPAPDPCIPIEFEFSMLEDGKLSMKRLRDALQCWKSDMEWVLEELDKVEPTEEESDSD